ncbi:Zn(II)2Cys6 transcription factor domain-containing protein [Aspergillus lucknowensis]|uniref:Zn(2)-C6 fungal-type domain-containing protein n=1 Tax=Aspergillus lucknowensis TaxID=176173 RepID=A0ABR4LY55_9EURO
MVGVPRNPSCRECLQRRVKCDRTRPECHRCQARGVRCPGYRRALKFYNQTTGHGDFTDAREFDRQQDEKRNPRPGRSRSTDALALALIRRPSFDDSLVPSLAGRALDSQTKEVFEYVVRATFPVTFSTFAPRLEPNWVDFIRYHQGARTESVERALRCLNTWYLGVKNKDPEIVGKSRYMYGGGLRCLAGLVANPNTRTSDITLATAVMLAVFEMLDPVTPQSWLVHSRGIGQLLQERGPRAYSSGFSRTIFVTIRSFMLADAFVREEASFLGQPEWRAVNQEATILDDRNGKGNWITKVVEEIFNEISLGPGFLAQTTTLVKGRSAGGVSREDLTCRIQHSRGILRNLQRQLASAAGLKTQLKEIKDIDKSGSYSLEHVRTIAGRCLQGLGAGLALLDQLLVLLEADKKRSGEGRVSEISWGDDRIPQPAATIEGPFSAADRPMDWLDQISMSMGTLAISNT